MSLMYYEAQVSERKSEREREREKKKTEREREGAREREREPLSQISIRRALDTKSNLSLGECIE